MTPSAAMLVLFDIDGTLLDSAGAGRAAIEAAMVEVYGTAGPIDELPFDGMTDPQIARTLLAAAGFAESDIAAGLEPLWVAYAARLRREIEVRRDRMRTEPGVPELLDALDDAEATLGLVTGNIAVGARGKLGACGLWNRFSFGAFGCDDADRNALPPIALARAFERTGTCHEAAHTWVVGDTPHDIACAHASDLRVLAVATGRFSVDALERAGADRALASLEDTEQVMSTLEDR